MWIYVYSASFSINDKIIDDDNYKNYLAQMNNKNTAIFLALTTFSLHSNTVQILLKMVQGKITHLYFVKLSLVKLQLLK